MYKRMNKGNYAKEAPNPSLSKIHSPNRSKRSNSLFEFRSPTQAPSDLATAEFNFYYWFNNQEKINVSQLKYHYYKQLQLIHSVVPQDPTDIIPVMVRYVFINTHYILGSTIWSNFSTLWRC
jgi:hypothetical protein